MCLQNFPPPGELSFSPRERQVVKLACHGHRAKAIAKELGIAHCTVKDHLRSFREKTGAETPQAIGAAAVYYGIIELP